MDAVIHVGKNARDNWELLENASADDLWFHVTSESSAYVIVENNEKPDNEIEKLTIYKAAAICKSRSKLKNTKKVSISYLPIQYVKKGKCVGEAILLKKPEYICV